MENNFIFPHISKFSPPYAVDFKMAIAQQCHKAQDKQALLLLKSVSPMYASCYPLATSLRKCILVSMRDNIEQIKF